MFLVISLHNVLPSVTGCVVNLSKNETLWVVFMLLAAFEIGKSASLNPINLVDLLYDGNSPSCVDVGDKAASVFGFFY